MQRFGQNHERVIAALTGWARFSMHLLSISRGNQIMHNMGPTVYEILGTKKSNLN